MEEDVTHKKMAQSGARAAEDAWVEFALRVRAEKAAAKTASCAKARMTPVMRCASRDKKQAPVISCYVFEGAAVCLEIPSANRRNFFRPAMICPRCRPRVLRPGDDVRRRPHRLLAPRKDAEPAGDFAGPNPGKFAGRKSPALSGQVVDFQRYGSLQKNSRKIASRPSSCVDQAGMTDTAMGSRRIAHAWSPSGGAVLPAIPKRSQSSRKNRAQSGVDTGPKTGGITGSITGLESPVMASQTIDSARYFFRQKISRKNASATPNRGGSKAREPCTALFAAPRDASAGGSYKRAMSQIEDTLFGDAAEASESYGRHSTGILPSHVLRRLIRARREVLAAEEIEETQIQPASLDLRVGAMAWRVRASFLPGPNATVRDKLATVALHEIDLTQGAVLETGCVYVVPLLESVEFSARVSGIANPKSSTGRLDVFTRLITDRAQGFDRIEPGYRGPLYAEISPRTFPVLVRKGSRLNQLRVRSGSPQFTDTQLKRLNAEQPLVDGPADIDNGLALSVDLRGDSVSKQVGWRAKRHTGIIDIDLRGALDPLEYWEPIYASRSETIVLDPDEFYILASREAVAIPPDFAAEMVPFNPLVGEFRVHYAGFFDPGFGHEQGRGRGARAVLEVRSREVPFIIEHGQIIGRLVFERLTDPPPEVYGQGIGSNYQRQGLKLSKHFRQA